MVTGEARWQVTQLLLPYPRHLWSQDKSCVCETFNAPVMAIFFLKI